MQLDSCRELKAELSRQLSEIRISTTNGTTATPVIALGIAPAADGEYTLAVRIHGDTDDGQSVEDLLARIDRDAYGEIDVRKVGPVHPLVVRPDIVDAADTAQTPNELQKRVRPLVPGLSIGHPDVTAGTLGGFVTVGGVLHVLSNNHVLANSDQAMFGDPILQPGTYDGGKLAKDRVATLVTFAPLSADSPNLVDAAIASLDAGIEADPRAYPGGPVGSVAVDPPEDPAVEKIGRTTGHTTGKITAFEVDGLRIDYDGRVLTFDDQIEIEGDNGAFSAGGDSGSVIWTSAGRAGYGLLFAGSTSGGSNGAGLTYANPLWMVLERLGVKWVGESVAESETKPH